MRLFIRPGLVETLLSISCLVVVLTALLAVDGDVRDRGYRLVSDVVGGQGPAIGERVAGLVEAVTRAAREHALDQGPLMVFAVVGVILLVFMLRVSCR